MPFVFYQSQIDAKTRADHEAMGGRDLTACFAEMSDGLLRVMSAKEPLHFGMLRHHVSISVGPRQGAPTRRPSDEEVKEVLSLWSLVEFEEDNDGGTSDMVRNFWEK